MPWQMNCFKKSYFPILVASSLATALIWSSAKADGIILSQTMERKRPAGTATPKIQKRKPLSSAIKNRVEPIERKDPSKFLPIPDRWRLIETVGVKESLLDPYNRNPLKGDRPLFGKDWFINVLVVSDTVYEPRSVPTPVGIQATDNENDLDTFGDANQWFFNENLILSFSLLKGDTAFKPPDYEFRVTPVINFSHAEVEELRALRADPRQGTQRTDRHFA